MGNYCSGNCCNYGFIGRFLPQERLAELIFVTRIFDVMLPVLAVGALVKYVFKQDKENK
ncbi:MAG: hypothetical protein HWD59_04180 [Coxiellaceae bacterium]|nr:MAG: hypothetical protein HWD59_04180 [Coxiellaceae bacterium]